MGIQCTSAVVCHWRYHRNLVLQQHLSETMLFKDGVIGPAIRAVELGGHWPAVGANAVHPVFITVQGQQFASTVIAIGFCSVKNHIWS